MAQGLKRRWFNFMMPGRGLPAFRCSLFAASVLNESMQTKRAIRYEQLFTEKL